MSTENLQESKDASKEEIDFVKVALSLLEKETRVNFFRNAFNGLKGFFGFNNSSRETNFAEINTSKSSESKNSIKSESNLNHANEHISETRVKQARNRILDGETFRSPSKGTITWGRNNYKHVCSTGSYAVLNLLGIENKSGNYNCDLKGTILPNMGFEYIGEVDPDNPGKDGYVPQNGDTAVWPRFRNINHYTQHQATFLAGHWVSDTIQDKLSCYSSKNEPKVKIYRYTGKNVA